MGIAAHRRLILVGVLLGASACESAPKSGPSNTAKASPAASRTTPVTATPAESKKSAEPIQPIELAGPSTDLAFSEGALYWTTRRAPALPQELHRHDLATSEQKVVLKGAIRDFKVAGNTLVALEGERVIHLALQTGEQRVLADNQPDLQALQLDATHAYWSIADTQHVRIGLNHPGSIHRVALAGGEPEELVADSGMGTFVLAGNDVLWSHRGISAVAKSGGEPRAVLSKDAANTEFPIPYGAPASLMVSVDDAFFAADGGAFHAPLSGGKAQNIYEADIVLSLLPIDETRTVVARGTSHFGDKIIQPGALVLVQDGKPTVLAKSERPTDIAYGDGSLYYIDAKEDAAQPGSIRSVALPVHP